MNPRHQQGRVTNMPLACSVGLLLSWDAMAPVNLLWLPIYMQRCKSMRQQNSCIWAKILGISSEAFCVSR